jgi:hypothetical protein
MALAVKSSTFRNALLSRLSFHEVFKPVRSMLLYERRIPCTGLIEEQATLTTS